MERQPQKIKQNPKKKKIIITGSKGVIGTVLTKSLAEHFVVIQLDKQIQPNNTTMFSVDIADQEALEKVFQSIGQIYYIIHLAANASPDAPWEEILRNNIIATKNVYEIARKHHVKRVIFASSTHLLGAYERYPQKSPFRRPITPADPPRPDSDYGTSKGFGELLARQYYDLYKIETICIRIGAVSKDNKPPVEPYEKLWLSHNDVAQVFKKALETEIPFGIYFATSENVEPTFDITPTKKDLGYNPVDGTRKT